jgi:hypothetical protein
MMADGDFDASVDVLLRVLSSTHIPRSLSTSIWHNANIRDDISLSSVMILRTQGLLLAAGARRRQSFRLLPWFVKLNVCSSGIDT